LRRNYFQYPLLVSILSSLMIAIPHPSPSDGLGYRLRFYHTHTGERLDVVYRHGDSYDSRAQARINQYLRDVADWYAAHGFVALVPDLFWRIKPNIELTDKGADWKRAIELYQQIDETKAVEDSAATLELLRKHTACSGRVGALGFCMGGNLAYLLSARFKPDCAVGSTASVSRRVSTRRRT